MSTDPVHIAITTNPDNTNEDITYSVEHGVWRAIPNGATLAALTAFGVPTKSLDANLWNGIKNNQGADW